MEALEYIQNFLLSHWQVIGTYLLAGGGISVVLQFVKKLRKWESKAWIEFVLGFLTTLTATADYVVNNYVTSPLPTIFGDFAPKILLAALLVHRIAVSPLTKFVEKQVVPFVFDLKEAMAQLKAEKEGAEVLKKTPVPTETFES